MFLIEKHDPYAPDDSGDERWEVETIEEFFARWDDQTGQGMPSKDEIAASPLGETFGCQWTDPETGVEVTARQA